MLREASLTGPETAGCSSRSPMPRPSWATWVRHYNFERRHQGVGDMVPWERFRLAAEDSLAVPARPAEPQPSQAQAASATRKVSASDKISFAAQLVSRRCVARG